MNKDMLTRDVTHIVLKKMRKQIAEQVEAEVRCHPEFTEDYITDEVYAKTRRSNPWSKRERDVLQEEFKHCLRLLAAAHRRPQTEIFNKLKNHYWFIKDGEVI